MNEDYTRFYIPPRDVSYIKVILWSTFPSNRPERDGYGQQSQKLQPYS